MHRKRYKISGGVPGQEDLRPDGVAGGPSYEVHGDDGGFFGLAGNVAGDEGYGEGLGGPEGEYRVVGD
jgi:hypothetical protein